MKRVKKRKVYRLDWYDIEGDAGWGAGAEQPPLVSQPCFIISWPRKRQKVPSFRIATAYCESEPGGSSVIPAAVVKGKPKVIDEWEIKYRD